MDSIGIIGHGAFGAFLEKLAKRFLPDARIRIHSQDRTPDGMRFFTLQEACDSSAVVFAVPIPAYEEAITAALPHIAAESVIVDISTVKMHTADILHRLAADRRYVVSHPMFGPESYAKLDGEVKGLRLVLCENTLAPVEYAAAKEYLARCGFDTVEMSADMHDKLLAEMLFLTHFVGQVVARAGFVRSDIDSVSFRFLMEAVESVKNDTALFKDVFRFNPYCKDVLDRFETAEREVRALLEG